MIYNHFSELPINAFKPSCGRMKLYGGGNPVSNVVNDVTDVVSNVGESISNTVSNVAQDIGSVGNQIDQSVNQNVPGGWATVGAAALAAATMGGSLAATSAADAAAMAAPAELDATGTLAATTAGSGAGAGTVAGAETGANYLTAGQNLGGSTLGSGYTGTTLGTAAAPTGLGTGTVSAGTGLGGLTSASAIPVGATGFSTDALLNAALTGAGKGALTNAAISALTGQPITPKGVATGALLGGVGGGAGNVAGQLGAGAIGSGIVGGATAGGTGALIGGGNVGKGALIGGLAGGTSAGVTDATGVPILGSVAGNLASNAANSALTPTTSSPTPETTLAALLASGALGVSNTNPSNTTTPSGGLTIADIPKSTLSKGNQISSPLASNYNIPVEAYNTPQNNSLSLQEIQNAKNGGIIHRATGGKSSVESNILEMKPQLMHGSQAPHANLFGSQGIPLYSLPSRADGGSLSMEDRTLPEGHNPQFFSEGGLNSIQHRYVTGDGDGTSDSIPAMLANGEFVIPADVVSSLGNGSNDSGAKVLDELLSVIREHKQKHDAKDLPPDSKGALAYLLQANKKARA